MPNLETADLWSEKLSKIRNIISDGRPILGLDVRNLLEITLEHKNSYLVPAHIWTPWFSLFGSKSGFNTIKDCFEDLSSKIFAMETGLSSNPPMNRKWSELDHCTLISNSDAHSGEKLGREVNIFHQATHYEGIFSALKRENKNFYGTIEFFPEEGKYHLDGHRKCNICFTPKESMEHNNTCPVCNKSLTVGVLHRIEILADREKPIPMPEQFESLIPLAEILAELHKCGVKTQKVHQALQACLLNLGAELDILHHTPLSQIEQFSPNLAEAIKRMREGTITFSSGFDGEFGKITLFNAHEQTFLKGL